MIAVSASDAKAHQLGIGLSLIANMVWGGAALYWLQTQPVSSLDVLAHRGVWTLPAALLVLFFARRFIATLRLLADLKTLFVMFCAAVLISINWGTFLYAVTHGHATQASLGYFLLPLLSVLLGVVLFGESPTRAQRWAIALALIAIGIQLLAVGGFPIISLTLSLSFAFYGVIRKTVKADAMQGLFIESLFLFPLGCGWLLIHDGAGLGAHSLRVDVFLVLSGAFTAIPLITHVMASRLLPLSTVGLLSYIGPSLQLVVAQLFLKEETPLLTLLSFAVVWCGLALIVADNMRQYRKSRRLAKATASSVTTERERAG